MSYGFSGELQQLVESELAKGIYASEDELLLVALKTYREHEDTVEELKSEVHSRIEALDRGESIELEDEQALRSFANEIKAEARRSLEAVRNLR